MTGCAVAVGVWLFTALAIWGGQHSSFDVASVKPTNAPDGGWALSPSGEVRFNSIPLHRIIAVAYGVPLNVARVKFVGGSPKILASSFTVHAKGSPGNDQLEMLRTLLAERFQLRTHTEIRQLPIYALSKRDRLGPGLRPAAYHCRALLAKESEEGRSNDLAVQLCRRRIAPRYGGLLHHWTGTINDLIARVAQPHFDRPVVDSTQLTGNFEWEVEFVSNDSRNREAPKISDAFEDQLGLKLVSTTGPYEVIVIDELRMPTPG